MSPAPQLDPRRSWPGFLLAASLLLTLLFTLLQPDISEGLSGIWLVLFWAAHVTIPLLLLQLAQIALSGLQPVAALNPWLQTALSGLVGSALFTPIALGLDAAFGLSANTEDLGMSWPAGLLDEFLSLAPIVTLVWLGLNATRLLRLDPPAALTQAAPVSEPEMWSRVPRGIGRDIVALTAELHYLRVRTTDGEALILYPFGKAVAELATAGVGLQVHRSHWVALVHVRQVDRRGQGAICWLASGPPVPVSRQYRAALLADWDAGPSGSASLRA